MLRQNWHYSNFLQDTFPHCSSLLNVCICDLCVWSMNWCVFLCLFCKTPQIHVRAHLFLPSFSRETRGIMRGLGALQLHDLLQPRLQQQTSKSGNTIVHNRKRNTKTMSNIWYIMHYYFVWKIDGKWCKNVSFAPDEQRCCCVSFLSCRYNVAFIFILLCGNTFCFLKQIRKTKTKHVILKWSFHKLCWIWLTLLNFQKQPGNIHVFHKK